MSTVNRSGYNFLQSYKLIWGILLSVWAVYKIISPDDFPMPAYIVFLLLGIACIVWGLLSIKSHPGRAGKVMSWIGTIFTAIYLLLEVTANLDTASKDGNAYIPDINSGFGVFSGPCAVYDPVRGYRWLPGTHRMSKILNDQVIYDQRFTINEQGFYSSHDFSQKKDSVQKRFILLGDSFTSGEYLGMPLGDRMNRLFISKKASVEVLPFAVNGGGLFNWHSMFFGEIVNNYEFDGVVLNIFGNDLQRKFFVMHHKPDCGYTGYFDTIPVDYKDYRSNYFPRSFPYAPYMADSLIDWQVQEVTRQKQVGGSIKPDLYIFKALLYSPILIRQSMQAGKFEEEHFVSQDHAVTISDAKVSLGEKQFNMLEEIVAYCKKNNKQVIFAQVPYQLSVSLSKQGKVSKEELYVRFLSGHFGVPYFDGISIYANMDEKELQSHFLPYDTHWTQQGSDLFARSLVEYLLAE